MPANTNSLDLAIGQLHKDFSLRFRQAGIESAPLDASLLLMHVSGLSKEFLLSHPEHRLSREEFSSLEKLAAKRADRIPLAYLVGKREFWSHELTTREEVLIPRPETEILVESVLRAAEQASLLSEAFRALDLGSGAGTISVTLAKELPQSLWTAVDISPQAIALSSQNAQKLGLANRVQCVLSDWYENLPPKFRQGFQVIVSNPPYIQSGQIPELMPEVRKEPVLALNGGQDGLECYRTIISGAGDWLCPGGLLFLEIGETLAAQILALLDQHDFESQKVIPDLTNRPRVIFAQRKKNGQDTH